MGLGSSIWIPGLLLPGELTLPVESRTWASVCTLTRECQAGPSPLRALQVEPSMLEHVLRSQAEPLTSWLPACPPRPRRTPARSFHRKLVSKDQRSHVAVALSAEPMSGKCL